MSGTALSAEEAAVIRRAWESIAPRIGNAALILFGSMTRGPVRPTSDIDLVIKAPRAVPLDVLAELEELFEESALVRSVDLLDYQRLTSAVQRAIDRNGVVIG